MMVRVWMVSILFLVACGRQPCPTETGPVVRLDSALGLCNAAPVARFSIATAVNRNEPITLDGTKSADPNEDPLEFSWSLSERPRGSAAAIDGPHQAVATFRADVAGSYAVRLVVGDGMNESAPVEAIFTAKDRAPTADAGPDQRVELGAPITFDGSASADPDDDPIIFEWMITKHPAASTATFVSPTLPIATFTPDVRGLYEATLIVHSTNLMSPPDTVVAAVGVSAGPPSADAGRDQSLVQGDTVHLDGSGSHDPDGDPLTYRWRFISAPSTPPTITDATTAMPSFVAVDAGDYVLELSVSDGFFDASAQVKITAQFDVVRASRVDGSKVWLIGTLHQGSSGLDLVCNPLDPDHPMAGFPNYDHSFAITKRHGLIYSIVSADETRSWVNDAVLGTLNRNYPGNVIQNDPIVPMACPDGSHSSRYVEHPGTGELFHWCRGGAQDLLIGDMGTMMSVPCDVHALGTDGSMACLSAVVDAGGTLHVLNLNGFQVAVRALPAARGPGFWLVVKAASNPETWSRFIVLPDGTMTLDADLGSIPTDWLASGFPGAIDGDGNFWSLTSKGGVDGIAEFVAGSPARIVYSEDVNDPLCKAHGSFLVTGF